MNLPSTIKHPNTFLNSPAAGFDGVFDWSWTDGCFGEGKITPMDFDGVVERKGNFILFETKGVGVPIPKGQMFTFESAYRLGCFTIVFIEGKESPEKAKVWCQDNFKLNKKMGSHAETTTERLSKFVAEWYQFAEENPRKYIDTSFLNKKISNLSYTADEVKKHLEASVNLYGGKVRW